MKPEKFIGIMIITLLLSCEMEDQSSDPLRGINQNIGEVSFETNRYIMNSSFDIDFYVDGKKIGSINNSIYNSNPANTYKEKIRKKLQIGNHKYEVKIYSYNGEASKKIKGEFIVKGNKTSKVFIDFKDYNNWI